jgi:hypothetical protein
MPNAGRTTIQKNGNDNERDRPRKHEGNQPRAHANDVTDERDNTAEGAEWAHEGHESKAHQQKTTNPCQPSDEGVGAGSILNIVSALTLADSMKLILSPALAGRHQPFYPIVPP